MDPERNRRIDSIFQNALTCDPAEREAYIDSACHGDLELKAEVEALLLSDELADNFIESPPVNVATAILDGNGDYSLVGKRIGPYKIISQIGSGGMGDVYLATDSRLGRNVALKLLSESLVPDSRFRSRFMREARLASMLDHPNICTIYDIGIDDDYLYIAMQFVEGDTLRRVINSAALRLDRIFSIGIQIGDAIAAAHADGIIHRDIKPENVIIKKDGMIKVLDFGLAKLISQEPAAPTQHGKGSALVTTTPGLILGTISYMSPEQTRGLPSDERSDMWAFGCVLYEMATGHAPFEGKSKADVIGAVLKERQTPAKSVNREIPASLSTIIDRSLAKEPDERFGSVSEMLDALRKAAIASGYSGGFTGPGKESFEAVSRRSGRKRSVIPASILSLVVLAALAAAYFYRPWTSGPLSPPRQRLISTFPGSHSAASFSPDGQRIAFVGSNGGVPQVFTKRLSDGDPSQITFGESGVTRPRWSPVADEIVYTRRSEAGPSIFAVTATGGEERKLIEGGRNPNWSWDGRRLVFERGYDIWVADADGSDQRKVDGVPTTDLLLTDRMPSLSPDGSLIVFFQKSKGPIGDYWVVPTDGGTARRLTFDETLGGAPVWSHDGQFVIFPSQRNGTRTLWKKPVDDGDAQPVLVSSGEDSDPEISRNGRMLIYTNTRNSFAVTITDARTGQSAELFASRSDLVDPLFSPTGEKILFFGFAESGGIHVFTVNSDGTGLEQVTTGREEHNIHPRWSGDGSAIYFYHQRPGVSFRKMSLNDGKVTDIAHGWEWATHNHASVDPSDRYVVYTKLDRGRPVATMIFDIATGSERPFPMLLRHHRWSHNGRFIVGTDVSQGNSKSAQVAVCPADGGSCKALVRGYDPHWSADDSSIYFGRDSTVNGEVTIWKISVDGTGEKQVAEIGPMQPIGKFFDIAPDGRIVWIKNQRGEPKLWLLDYTDQPSGH